MSIRPSAERAFCNRLNVPETDRVASLAAISNLLMAMLSWEGPFTSSLRVMLSSEIVLKFAPESAKYPLYALAGQMYSTVAFEAGYAFWDTVTTAYLDRPDLYTIEQKKLLNVTSGLDEGNIIENTDGYLVNVVTNIDVDGFYAYIFKQWKKL